MGHDIPVGYRCPNCGWIQTYNQPYCGQCNYEDELDEIELSNTGVVLSSVVLNSYEENNSAVYAVVLLDSGGEVLAQLDDCTTLHSVEGIPVELTKRLESRKSHMGGPIGYLWRGALLL